MNCNHLIILAGGADDQFWPLSNEQCPKQFCDVLNCGQTLLQQTYFHFKELFDLENIWVVTNEIYVPFVQEQLPEICKDNILEEPVNRGTASSIAYASWRIKNKDSRANVVVTPCDHIIDNIKVFQETIRDCMNFTAETDAIVTIGIQPSKPEVEYGYIEADLSYASSQNSSIYRVDHFVEKPTLETAKSYLLSKGVFWNSGIFVWSVNTIINAFRIYKPAMAKFFESMKSVYGTSLERQYVKEHYDECENISIDYAIMEKVEEIYVYAATFGWGDIGSWAALHNEMEKDTHDNVVVGNVSTFDTFHCMIHAPSMKKIVIQGLDGYIISEKDGILMICKMSEEERIKLFH